MVKGKKNTKYGLIPQEWNVLAFSKCADIRDGTHDTPQPMLSGYPLVTSKNLKNGKIDLTDTYNISSEDYAKINKRSAVEQGDILYAMIGTIGNPILIEFQPKFAIKNVALFKPYDSSIGRYLKYYLQCSYFLKEINDAQNGSNQNFISLSAFRNMQIIIPGVDERIAIAEALSDVDSLIFSLQKLIEKKKAIKQGTMQELLTGKRRLPGFHGEWKVIRIGETLSIGHGQSQKTVENRFGKYPILATGGCIGYADNFLWDKPSVLIGRKGTIDKPQYADYPFWTIDTLFYTKIFEEYDAKFIFYKFCIIDWQQYNEASGVPSLSAGTIGNLYITVPEKYEQQAIAQILSDMDSEIEQLEKKLAKYQQIKQGMMQELLTGRIRLVDADCKEQSKTQAVQEKQLKPAHNQHFDDAVMIAGIVNAFYSEKYPLGRKKVQKLLYLVRRKEQADTSAFHKKAAGPYADEIRYKGGEPIAQKNRYIQVKKSDKGSSFEKGAKMRQALTYLQDWKKQVDIDWLVSQFQYTGVNELELLATVDMAMCDLCMDGKEVSVTSIKDLIRSNKEWQDKLNKTYFRDADIQRAIKRCQELFRK